MKKFNSLKIFIATLVFLTPLFSFAQFGPEVASNTIDLTLLPANPGPNQSVIATVSSLEFNIDLAKISWSLGTKVLKSGQGVKSVSFTSPAAGKSEILSVVVTPAGKSAITTSISVAPGGTMDLIFETVDGYTPPFYRGKTLPIKQSAIKVVAMPVVKSSNGAFAKPGTFAYTWEKDGTNAGGQSGLGKNSIVFGNQILENSNRVEVSATNGLETVKGSITVVPFTPEILFYEYDQSLGMGQYNKVFQNNTSIEQPRLTLVAEPYFLMKDWPNNKDVIFNWTLNNQPAKAGEKNTLGIITTTKGQVDVGVTYDETQKLFRNIKAFTRFNVQ